MEEKDFPSEENVSGAEFFKKLLSTLRDDMELNDVIDGSAQFMAMITANSPQDELREEIITYFHAAFDCYLVQALEQLGKHPTENELARHASGKEKFEEEDENSPPAGTTLQ